MSEPVVKLSGPAWLVVELALNNLPPEEAISWFTHAERLNRWWGNEALIEPRPGGMFVVRWPGMDWVMQGTVGMVSDTSLLWSWTWAHEPDAPARAVLVESLPDNGGSVIRITHGPYRTSGLFADADAQDREEHAEGWLHFLPALTSAVDADLVAAAPFGGAEDGRSR